MSFELAAAGLLVAGSVALITLTAKQKADKALAESKDLRELLLAKEQPQQKRI